MACSITIAAVTVTAASGGMATQVVVQGSAADCASDQVEVSLVCDQTVTRVVKIANDGSWSASFVGIVSALPCRCGQQATVRATCFNDPTCTTSTVVVIQSRTIMS